MTETKLYYTTSVLDVYGEDFPALAPTGFKFKLTPYNERTFRMVANGEFFMNPKGEANELLTGDVQPAGPRLILEKQIRDYTVKEVYGMDTPKAPDGYDLGIFKQMWGNEKESWLVVSGIGIFDEIPSRYWNKKDYYPINANSSNWRYTLVKKKTPPKKIQPFISGLEFETTFKPQEFKVYAKDEKGTWHRLNLTDHVQS